MIRPPGPLGERLAGNGPAYEQDRLGFMVRMSEEYGAIWSFDRHIVVVADPALAGDVLLRTNTDFGAEVDFLHRKQKDDAETRRQWASSRAARMRAMRPTAMHVQIPMMAAEIGGGISRWGTGDIDVVDRMRAVTAAVGALFCLSDDAHLVAGLARELFGALTPVVSSTMPLPLWLPLPRHRRVMRANRQLEGVIGQVIKRRRGEARDGGRDLLDVLMQPTARHGELPEAIIRETVVATLLAAENTSAAGFGWVVHELSRNPEAQERAAEEAAAVLPDPASISHTDYNQLGYTARVVKEALRLWPPNWMMARHVLRETTLGGYTLERGTKVMVPAYVIQRDARWFPDPERFDPDRWLPDGSGTAAPSNAYLPFGAGPLICMGMSWSLIEMTLAAALMVRSFRVSQPSGAKVVPDPSRGLAPTGLMVRLDARPSIGQSYPSAAHPAPVRTPVSDERRCPVADGIE
ncbi:cytochrome P450 [Streptomyces sp. NPDC051315]|uniref:cytochrome P450 n=1 Tax=Streptomyces sp. NPDC051315 TaxID=3365650 RepID=UPI0037A0B0F6